MDALGYFPSVLKHGEFYKNTRGITNTLLNLEEIRILGGIEGS